MLFTEAVFAPFLLLTLLALATMSGRPRGQLLVMLVASYVFYGWWDVRFLVLIVFSSVLDYYVGRAIAGSDNPRHRRGFLLLSLGGNLGLLAYFKYANFFIDSLFEALRTINVSVQTEPLEIVLPVGISFYTFQTLSYTIDIYLRRIEPTDSLLRFLVYVSAFPQLVAGPIVRARQLLPQLTGDFFSRSNSAGVVYIFYGLFKKLFLADNLGVHIVDRLFREPHQFGGQDVLFGVYAYSFQIFLDFSAYSDIAIGVGLLLGLKLPVNFRSPFAAQNPADFWRRWHITLSTWFRDYVYIPLGGNRVSDARLFANLMIVMLLAGLWHGAAWTFVIWGGLHGCWLVLHRMLASRRPARNYGRWQPWMGAAATIGTFQLVSFAFVFFRAPDIGRALAVLERLWHGTRIPLATPSLLALLGLCVLVHTFAEPRIERIGAAFARLPVGIQAFAIYWLLTILLLSAREDLKDRLFIYFQF